MRKQLVKNSSVVRLCAIWLEELEEVKKSVSLYHEIGG